jgi:hypothetical protein
MVVERVLGNVLKCGAQLFAVLRKKKFWLHDIELSTFFPSLARQHTRPYLAPGAKLAGRISPITILSRLQDKSADSILLVQQA